MKKIILSILTLCSTSIFPCGHCTLFVLEKYRDVAYEKCSEEMEVDLDFDLDDLTDEELGYFYLGQITAYENAINDLRYRVVDILHVLPISKKLRGNHIS